MKGAMSGQDISWGARLLSSWNILRAYRSGYFADTRTKIRHHRRLCEVLRANTGLESDEAVVLDLGCGQMATETALFAAEGADVVGIDIEIPTFRMNPKIFVEVAKTNGFERAVKSLLRHVLFDRKFFDALSEEIGKPIPLGDLDIRIMDANRLEFPDDHFDFVHSAWSFEHIADVPAAIREVNRVLKPTGVAWIGTHLFPSLSGGHHLDWGVPETADTEVPPWSHLREDAHPVNTYLNQLRLAEYREIFHRETVLVDEELVTEGESRLTPELEAELSGRGYTREDLLTRAQLWTCKKKQ